MKGNLGNFNNLCWGGEEGLYILERKIFLLQWLPGLHKIGRNLKAYWQVFYAVEDRSITEKWGERRWGGGQLTSQHNFHFFSCLIIKSTPFFRAYPISPIYWRIFDYLRLCLQILVQDYFNTALTHLWDVTASTVNLL